jgi:hypothetical protein
LVTIQDSSAGGVLNSDLPLETSITTECTEDLLRAIRTSLGPAADFYFR